MKIGVFNIGAIILVLTLIGTTPANAKKPLDEENALSVVLSQIKNDKLYDSWTSLACLSFITEENTKSYFDFAIREKHGGECPGAPYTAPVVDRFRVNRLTKKIEWYEPAEGEFQPYKAVFNVRQRNSVAVSASDCEALEKKAIKVGTHIPSHMSGRVVIGKGRLQFFSAPNLNCKQSGIFILPSEGVDAYLKYKGFTSVHYINPKTGTEVDGWVLSARLKETGYGIRPKQ